MCHKIVIFPNGSCHKKFQYRAHRVCGPMILLVLILVHGVEISPPRASSRKADLSAEARRAKAEGLSGTHSVTCPPSGPKVRLPDKPAVGIRQPTPAPPSPFGLRWAGRGGPLGASSPPHPARVIPTRARHPGKPKGLSGTHSGRWTGHGMGPGQSPLRSDFRDDARGWDDARRKGGGRPSPQVGNASPARG